MDNESLSESNTIFHFQNIKKKEQNLIIAWNKLRDDLKIKKYLYDDINQAKQNEFLFEFDSFLSSPCIRSLFTCKLKDIFDNNIVGRGTIIKSDESTPTYERFIPKSEFIKECNRFSPEKCEWLYLTFDSKKNTKAFSNILICSQKECGAKANDKFAFCLFQNVIEDYEVFDLTQGVSYTFEDLKQNMIERTNQIIKRDAEALRHSKKHPNLMDIINRCNILKSGPLTDEQNKYMAYALSKMLSESLFLPIIDEDKSITYAPFQCMAQYFLSLGYCGIIYKSTVCDSGKNIVLFDKSLAIPYGNIKQVIL